MRCLPAPILLAATLLAVGLPPTPGSAQGRYQAQGAAQRHFQDGEEAIGRAEDARADGEAEDAREAFRDAVAAFEKAIDADPEYVDAYARLGRVYLDLEQPARAIPILERGRARVADSDEIAFWLGQHLLLSGDAARTTEAVDMLTRAADRTDDFPAAHLVLGNHFYDGGRFADAGTRYTRYLEEQPDAIDVRARLGNCYVRQARFADALKAFERVREADPDNVPVLVNIGTAHLRLKQYDAAVRTMSAALERDPQRQTARFGLAYAHFAAARPMEALPHFATFVEARPKSFNGRYFGGSALMAAGRDDAALPELQEAAELRADVAQPRYKIGIIHLRNGRLEPAQAALEQARAIAPTDPWILSALGTVARAGERFDAALELHRQAVEKGPDFARLHANRAMSALAAGQAEEAERAVDAALKLDRTDDWVLDAALAVLTRLAKDAAPADPTRAIALLERAAAVRPADARIEAGLIALRSEQARPAEALAAAEALANRDAAAARAALARAHFAAGQFAEAAAAYRALAEDTPALSAAGEGAALLAAGDIEQALPRLEKARELNAKASHVARNLGLARLWRASKSLGRRLDAAADVRAAVDADAHLDAIDVARAHYAALILALRRNKDREADGHLRRMTRAARQAPDGARFYARRLGGRHVDVLTARVNLMRGNHDRAIKLLESVREARSGRTEAGKLLRSARHEAGRALARDGDLKGARAQLDAAAGLGESPALRHDIAVVDWLGGKKKRQLALWTRQADKGLREARFNAGVALEAAGRHEDAWRAFSRAAEAGGRLATKAAEIADAKRRVFGFSEGAE